MTYHDPQILNQDQIADLIWGKKKPKNWYDMILYRINHMQLPARNVAPNRILAERDSFLAWINKSAA